MNVHDACIAWCCNVSYIKDIESDRSLYNLRLISRLQHEAMGSTVLSLRDDAEAWFVPKLCRNTLIRPEWHSMRRRVKKSEEKSSNINEFPKHLEAPWSLWRLTQPCKFQQNRWRHPSAPWQVKLSDCSFLENTGTCIAARNSATVVVERGTFTQNGAPVIQLRDSTTLRCLSLRIPEGLMALFLECLELLSLKFRIDLD